MNKYQGQQWEKKEGGVIMGLVLPGMPISHPRSLRYIIVTNHEV